jgi:hypothetical protein
LDVKYYRSFDKMGKGSKKKGEPWFLKHEEMKGVWNCLAGDAGRLRVPRSQEYEVLVFHDICLYVVG